MKKSHAPASFASCAADDRAAAGGLRPESACAWAISPGRRHAVDEDELDPLDVTDDGASHSAAGLHVSAR